MKERISSYAIAGSACSLLATGTITFVYLNRHLVSRATLFSLLLYIACYYLPLFGVWFSLAAKREIANPNKGVAGERLANLGLVIGLILFAVMVGSIV